MTGDRYRMVHVYNGTEHVNSVVLGESEVAEHLEWEQQIHEAAGWRVEWAREHSVKFPQLLCVRGRSARRIYAKRFRPMEDSVAAQVDSPPVPAPPPTQERT